MRLRDECSKWELPKARGRGAVERPMIDRKAVIDYGPTNRMIRAFNLGLLASEQCGQLLRPLSGFLIGNEEDDEALQVPTKGVEVAVCPEYGTIRGLGTKALEGWRIPIVSSNSLPLILLQFELPVNPQASGTGGQQYDLVYDASGNYDAGGKIDPRPFEDYVLQRAVENLTHPLQECNQQ